jgi:hypothetical protein
MRLLGRQVSPRSTARSAGTRLGFNRAALALVIDAAPASPWAYWGFAESGNSVPDPRKPDDPAATVTGTWLELLAFVPIVLQPAGVSHRELIQLLATRFVNLAARSRSSRRAPTGSHTATSRSRRSRRGRRRH